MITKMRILEAGNSWQHGKEAAVPLQGKPEENGGTVSPFSLLPVLQEEGISFSSSTDIHSSVTKDHPSREGIV